jgi:hypothetical protein
MGNRYVNVNRLMEEQGRRRRQREKIREKDTIIKNPLTRMLLHA